MKKTDTHGRYKRICGEAVEISGDLKGMSLTGSVRASVPTLRYRAGISYGPGDKEGLGGASSRVIVGEEKQPGGCPASSQAKFI